MKAIILKEFGGVENLQIAEIAAPEIKENEVLIRVKAISINPVDAKSRAGKGVAKILKDEDPIILGWDISGVVVGSNSAKFKEQDEVFGMVNFPGHGKAYAEYVAVPAEQLAIKPANVSHEDAAAATLAALTAWQNLTKFYEVKKGDRILIHAASGGVGHYAVQMAKHLGAYVIGTSSAYNKDFAMSLGLDEFIDYKSQKFQEMVSNIDMVLDTIGGDNIDPSLDVTKKGGTVISIPSGLNEAVKEKAKEKGINGINTMVVSSGTDMEAIARLLADGSVKSHVTGIYTFDEMDKAHLQIESGSTRGKVVVLV
ncbi:NADP-dependent oxidoreductase [Pedobacter sp. L105]|uniref:NADP-dependent oxidoreductase n=1 Tax=Pedobacter sp. L105 TaxID=1641871 RepID=UPI00131C90F2|nr:NADP-dependent oxidoreductase [Pedobacter sp. L105]